MVGSRFCELSKDDFNLIKTDLHGDIPVDITNKDSVNELFKNFKFDACILFSAFTDVDAAQKEAGDKTGICWKINADGVKNVASAARANNVKLIFISTDFVFDGSAGPYSETDPPGPDLNKVSWYGITKMEGEKIVGSLDNSIILRIAYPYRGKFEAKDDIAKRVLRMYGQDKLYPMFADQTFTPTLIDDLAGAVSVLIEKNASGIFHLASPKPANHYDFARRLLTVFAKDPNIVQKGSLAEFLKKPGVTPRPINCALKTDKIQSLGFVPTSWEKGIETIHRQSAGQLI